MEVKLFYINFLKDFLYNKFFDEHLMKLSRDAEKIVIYLTPFVLKINLQIIIYEFDNDSSVHTKDFPCYLENKPSICLLYRKTHYDLVYNSNYFGKYSKELCYFVNLEENLKVVDNRLLEDARNKNRKEEIFKIKLQDLNNSTNIVNNKNELEKNPNSNIEDINVQFPTCITCKNSYINKQNQFNMCITCLTNELNDLIMANYFVYIGECVVLYQEGKESEISKIYEDCIYFIIITL